MCTLQEKKEEMLTKIEKAKDFILWQLYKITNLL